MGTAAGLVVALGLAQVLGMVRRGKETTAGLLQIVLGEVEEELERLEELRQVRRLGELGELALQVRYLGVL